MARGNKPPPGHSEVFYFVIFKKLAIQYLLIQAYSNLVELLIWM